MNLLVALLIFISIGGFVCGHILLKHATDLIERANASRLRAALVFSAAIIGFAANFFLNIGLLQRFDLSYFFPFQGTSVILIALAGAIFLREKVSLRLTIGSLVISLGIALVSLS